MWMLQFFPNDPAELAFGRTKTHILLYTLRIFLEAPDRFFQ